MINSKQNPVEFPIERHLAPGELTPEESKEKENAKEQIVKYLSIGAFDKAFEAYSFYENLGLDEAEIISEGARQYVHNNLPFEDGIEKLIENKDSFKLLYEDVFSSPHFTEWLKVVMAINLS